MCVIHVYKQPTVNVCTQFRNMTFSSDSIFYTNCMLLTCLERAEICSTLCHLNYLIISCTDELLHCTTVNVSHEELAEFILINLKLHQLCCLSKVLKLKVKVQQLGDFHMFSFCGHLSPAGGSRGFINLY